MKLSTSTQRPSPKLSITAAPPSRSLPLPRPQGGKIGLLLKERTDAELIQLGQQHAVAMDDNSLFPNPIPSTESYDELLAQFCAATEELQSMRVLLQGLTMEKDKLRAAFQTALTRRARYIELASDGNPDFIATTGLPSRRRAAKSIGEVSPPQGLQLLLSARGSALTLRWFRVRGARSYSIEYAQLTPDAPPEWKFAAITGKTKYVFLYLTPGQTYVFRIATIGGSTGQSDWSPPVTRMAA